MSIYELLGGEAVVTEAVDRFYARLQEDPILEGFFQGSKIGDLKSFQRMFLTAALGGPDAYEGRDMRAAHAHLPITDDDFDLFMGHLADTLDELEIEQSRVNRVLDALSSLRPEIVAAASAGVDEWGSRDRSGGSG